MYSKNNKIFIVTIMTLFISLFLVSPVISNNNTEKGIISVSISESKELTPNVAEITFSVKTTDVKSIQKAIDDNKLIMSNAFQSLEKMINKQNGDYIKTSNFNAVPKYYYEDSKQIFNGYEVTNQIIVHTKSLDILGQIIDMGIKSGINNVSNLNFSLQNYDDECNKLIESTTKKAKYRANSVAQALSVSITGIKNIDASCTTNSVSPRLYLQKNALPLSDNSVNDSVTNINIGNIKLNANINSAFYVK